MLPERLEWLTTAQIAMLALPGLPETQQGVDALARAADGPIRGGRGCGGGAGRDAGRGSSIAGWCCRNHLPSERTFARRVETLPPQTVVLAREGRETFDRLYPAQKRDKRALHALEAVNLDGHRWDVAVEWPDGQIGRPQMLTVQDIYSGAILAWRVDRTLHKGLVRLAIGDVVEQWGIPEHCTMDNGRENAAKWITGGVPNRFRFKVRDEDVLGLLPQLGIEVHWAQPYRGQSKPIERAFRDFAGGIAKHPAFAGAYLGTSRTPSRRITGAGRCRSTGS